MSNAIILRRLLFAALALMVATGAAYSQNVYYVRAGASGTRNGADWNNAFADLPSIMVRGATYYIAGGNYAMPVLQQPASGTTVITIKKAIPSDHGTDTGWSGSFASSQTVFAAPLQIWTSFWIIDGQTGGGPGAWTNGLGIKIDATDRNTALPGVWVRPPNTGQHNIVLRHIEIAGDGGSDDTAPYCNDAFSFEDGTHDITVAYCYSHDMGRCHFRSSCHNLNVSYMYGGWFESTAAQHAQIASIWTGTTSSDPAYGITNVTFANCVWSHVIATGGITMQGDGLNVYGNVFYRPAGDTFSGQGAVCTWTGSRLVNVKLYNNSFIDFGSAPVLQPMGSTSGNNLAYNNIFYNSPVNFGDYAAHDYNLFINSTGDGASSEAHGATASSNPFKNYLGLDFTLTSNTFGGMNLGAAFNLDPNAFSRTTWTRGAYEYGSVLVNSSPVLALAASSLDFGTVPVNTSTNLGVTIRNSAGGTLVGSASVVAPFSILSGSPYSLGAGQSQTVTVCYSPSSVGTNTQNVIFTGANGATCAVAGIAVAPAGISVTPSSQDFGSVTVGSTADLNFTLQNTGTGSFSGTANVPAPFSVVSGSPYNLAAGQSQTVTVRYTPTAVRTDKQVVSFTGGAGATVSVSGVGAAAPLGLSFSSAAGAVSPPFVVNNGYVSQPLTTTVADGGRACYTFTVTNAGNYVIQALVNAPTLYQNSFYVNIDAEPQDETMAWDVLPPTSGVEARLISARGAGTTDLDLIVPKVFNLSAGTHQLIIRGRESDAQFGQITLVQLPQAPKNLRVQ